ncbi:MAG: ATP-binding protein [Clostridiales bacterium]|nr:ATP-binding protein [Clostridiales bacterium]
MFFGRKEELSFLEEKYMSSKAEFVVLYGRRRIGKTALIQEFVKDKAHVFYSAVQITDGVQLQKMSKIIKQFYGDVLYSNQFFDWESLFRFISDHTLKEKKMILVIDEFPYMVQGNKSIPSILQNLWDHHLSQHNIMIILCGSSMSFMEKEILSEKNPLYGRATGIYKIKELDFESARAFMGNETLVEHINYYSAFSGVPYYLSLINAKDSFENNVKNNILRNGSVLFNEVEFLLKQELREVNQYNAIIESIALGDTKINGIYQKTGIEKNKLPYYINNLIELGIIEREYPAVMKMKEQTKTKSGIYKISNSYFKFYYAFVYPYMSELQEGSEDIIFEDVILEQLPQFVSYEFEKIATAHLRQLSKNGDIPIRPIKYGRWWYKDNEIDIIAFDNKNNFIVGECKWKNSKVGKKTLNQLQIKVEKLDIKANEIYFALYSKSGFTDDLVNFCKDDSNVILVDYSCKEPMVIMNKKR